MNLNQKAGWEHYVLVGLTVLGIWYVFQSVTGKQSLSGPLADTTVDVTTLVVFGS